MEPGRVALPHLEGAKTLLDFALDADGCPTGRARELVLRALGKLADVRELIDPDAGFQVTIKEDDDEDR